MALGRATAALTSAGGAALGVVFRVAGEIPHRDKPLHPRGRVLRGTLRRHGLEPRTGVEFLDTQRTDEVLLRESRSIGLPTGLPDISGLAVRVTEPDGSHSDLLFSNNGWGRLTRYLLIPSRTTYGRPMTTLFPYRSAAGPVLIGVRSAGDRVLEVACAIEGGAWRTFAELELTDSEGDPAISFDAVLNVPPGLEQYDAVRRVREPAYRGARASRE